MGYRVYVRGAVHNGERRIVGEIDTWIKLDFTVRFNAPGTWQLLVKSGTHQESLLRQGRGIVIYQDGVPTPVFSGQIDAFERYWTTDQHTAAGSVFVGGKCDTDLVYGFLAFPGSKGAGTDTMTALPLNKQYAGQDHRPAGGPLGQALWLEADLAFGARALPDRKVDGLEVGGANALGGTLKDTLRFDNLGAKFEEWLKGKRLGYRLIWDHASRKIQMRVYECRDLSGSVRFSPDLGNLRQYEWQLKAPKTTRAIVACQGEGAERYLWQKIDFDGEAQWGVKRETFVDRRDIPLKTGKGGEPELVVRKQGETEDLGTGPDGAEWTPALAAAKKRQAAAQAAAEKAKQDAEAAKTEAEKSKAAAAQAAAAIETANAAAELAGATQAAKKVMLDHYVKAVEEAAVKALSEGEKTGHFQIYPIDTEQTRFGRDYFVGDVVTIAADGEEYQDVVKEVNISVEDGGRLQSVTPKIGDQGTGEPLNLYKTVWEMKEKLRKLESRM
ncbi:hypothetical protein [Streptomyces sp. NPDC018045]|uniref:Gp37-like protein n=1 Tax=Streptomyces sp. NPDC018045 TaxID=3365037 RepID=UPI00379D361A